MLRDLLYEQGQVSGQFCLYMTLNHLCVESGEGFTANMAF